ncbi:MAG: thioredoxin domain-containing protein [Steroidobacteraceae bacterium]
MHTNRLIGQTSPYLQAHAHNPVDWYPWGNEAFERAAAEGKPVHLSIGYSSCHWCHVLAEESFEDPATAQLLNERFVNIKVDREERPDIDRIYQIAQALITHRSGGWPLTMFLSPQDRRPFFGGTYFPPQPRHGLPAFSDVLTRVADYYASHRDELAAQSGALVQALAEMDAAAPSSRARLDGGPIAAAHATLAANFDGRFGGFGGAPKFPHPDTLELLLAGSEADARAREMATLTLRRMAEGGIDDQLAGGFCRYSVDPYWMIPHFEKMLYDNGALLAVYADAALAAGDPLFARTAAATAEWLIEALQSPAGGFYSSFDADSEGREGEYYVWKREEVEQALSPQEYSAFAPRFGLDREPNFEGRWHLHTFVSLEELADRLGKPREALEALIESARRKLLAIRARRVPPARDDKILTSWNALAIRGMARAAASLGREDFAASSSRALAFLKERHWKDGRLLATSRDGRAHLPAYLDDYAYLAAAVLELLTVRFSADDLEFARQLIEVVLAHFVDPGSGGLYFTSDEHEALIHRSMSFADDATPSGNGVAALVLARMGYLLGSTRYLEASERILRAAWSAVEARPAAHVSLLLALEEHLHPPQIVILRGESPELERWRAELAKRRAPHRIVLAIPATETPSLPAALAEKAPRGRAVAYVCRGTVCSAPIETYAELASVLGGAADAAGAAAGE